MDQIPVVVNLDMSIGPFLTAILATHLVLFQLYVIWQTAKPKYAQFARALCIDVGLLCFVSVLVYLILSID